MLKPIFVGLLTAALPFTANAAILNATPANIMTVWAQAQSGDTIVATGTYDFVALQNRTFNTRVTLDATNATFNNSMTIQNVTGLTVLRGTFGSRTTALNNRRAVMINKSSNVKFQNSLFLGNGVTAGENASYGVTIDNSTVVQISAGTFNNFRVGIGVVSSNNVKLDSSIFTAMTSDAMNIVDSRFVTATANTCRGTTPYPGAHPDCIQLWSLVGKPVQSDIILQRNTARDATQGFSSFNPQDGGALRVSIIGNTVATSYPEGIACYNCRDSIFTDNILSTLPGSLYQTTVNINGGSNNIIARNSIAAYLQWPAQLRAQDSASNGTGDYFGRSIEQILAEDYALLKGNYGDEASAFLDDAEGFLMADGFDVASQAVPEPGIWAQLILGFGLVGGLARRRMHAHA